MTTVIIDGKINTPRPYPTVVVVGDAAKVADTSGWDRDEFLLVDGVRWHDAEPYAGFDQEYNTAALYGRDMTAPIVGESPQGRAQYVVIDGGTVRRWVGQCGESGFPLAVQVVEMRPYRFDGLRLGVWDRESGVFYGLSPE